MSRKQFIISKGATCKNWTWSWSFINEADKIVIFGAWDNNRIADNTTLIFDEAWRYDISGSKKTASYTQSREHIRLVEEEGYQLKTFPIIYSNEHREKNGVGPAKIKKFIRKLDAKSLIRRGDKWYASDYTASIFLPEEIVSPRLYREGTSKQIFVNAYERNLEAREKCIEHYGYMCTVCSFDFEKVYGVVGKGFIHVHHLVPLSEVRQEYHLDPIKDLRPVCPNCHAMIHRIQPALTIEQLKLRHNKIVG